MRRSSLKTTKLVVLAILAFASAVTAQDRRISAESPSVEARGAFVALVVTDLEASERWYESNLALHLLKRSRSPRIPAETLVLEGRNLFVELIHFENAMSAKSSEAGDKVPAPGFIKVGMMVSGRDFDSLARRLQKRRVEFVGGVFEDKEMGVRTFLVKDNSGNRIQFFSRIVRASRRMN